MLGNGNPICDALDHRWLEEYYGYKCENCGAFIPYGCEPWADDDNTEQSEPEVAGFEDEEFDALLDNDIDGK